MRTIREPRGVLFVALGPVLAAGASAQTLYGVDGDPGGGRPVVYEFTGGASGVACGYPDPLVQSFPVTAGVICGSLAPFPPTAGDVAVDTLTDLVYTTDGFLIVRSQPNGSTVDSFAPPVGMGPIVGMGMASSSPHVWVTDGQLYGSFFPPGLHACQVPAPSWSHPPTAVPGFFAAALGDIEWDPGNGELVACDLAGRVGSFSPGSSVPGGYGVADVAGGPCGLAPTLTGIAVDRSLPGAQAYFVTDGRRIASLTQRGGAASPALPSFTMPSTCQLSTVPLAGLAYSSRAAPYGPTGSDKTGLGIPTIAMVGQSVAENDVVFTLQGAAPGAVAYLFYSSMGAACPSLQLVGLLSYLDPPLLSAPPVMTDPGGNAFRAVTIPNVPLGKTFHLQWVVVSGAGLQATKGIGVTFARP